MTEVRHHLTVAATASFAIGAILATSNTLAAEVTYTRGSPERLQGHVGIAPDEWRSRISITGQLLPGDDKRFVEVLKQAQSDGETWTRERRVLLNSAGGDVSSAMSIGRTIRKASLATAVHDGSVCASACIVILAGGVWRYAHDGARLGLHRPYFANPKSATAKGYDTFQQAYDSIIESHRKYFLEMKIGSGILDRMVQVPSNEIYWVSLSLAKQLNLLGEDAANAEWRRAQRIARDGQACVDWQDHYYLPCISKLGIEASARCEALPSKPPNCN